MCISRILTPGNHPTPQIPKDPAEQVPQGSPFMAVGSPKQLKDLLIELTGQAGPTARLNEDAEAQQWCYSNPEGEHFGPFTVVQLAKWNAKGAWPRTFPIQHQASAIWVPIWLVLRLYPQAAVLAAQQASSKAAVQPTAAPSHADSDDVVMVSGLLHLPCLHHHAHPHDAHTPGVCSAPITHPAGDPQKRSAPTCLLTHACRIA